MIVEQDFFVGVQAVNRNKVITNHALLEMFSNMSMLHSFKAGHTKDSGLSPVSWVVMNWKMKVYRRVKLFSTVRAKAWIRKAVGYRAYRSYAAFDESGNLIAEATGEWVAMNTEKGTFIRLKPEFMENYGIEDARAEDEPFSGYRSVDLQQDCPEPELRILADVYPRFYDYNSHVHNSEYLHFAELILPEKYSMEDMDLIELQYKLEIRADEPKVLVCYAERDGRHFITVRNAEDNGFHAGIILTEKA